MYFGKNFVWFSACGNGFVVDCLGFLSSSQSRALCALHKPARSVRSPGHCPFRNPLCLIVRKKALHPCVKQIQNGSVLDLFAAVNGRRRIRSWPCLIVRNWTEWNNFVKNYETELHSSERCVIQDSNPVRRTWNI